MTAQIAILNKHGIALATDSAVTISGDVNENKKVYNSANKLFSLSTKNPVGIMIYGTAQFMNVPWETIIKSYRSYLGDRTFDYLEDYCNDFVEYIKTSDLLIDNYPYDVMLNKTLSTYLTIILNQVNKKLRQIEEKHRTDQTISELIYSEANSTLKKLGNVKYIDGFNKGFIETLLEEKEDLLNNVIDENIYIEVTSDLRILLNNLLGTLLAKDFFSSISTGVVIAGYGVKEIFPRLNEYKFEGIFLSKLKYKLHSSVKIGSHVTTETPTASIKAFAQREMVHTFLSGSDSSIINQILGSVYDILKNVYPSVLEEKLGVELNEEMKDQLKGISSSIHREISNNVQTYQRKNFSMPILDTVQLMPKEEMGVVAETLLNLASLKKRVTLETESVGGPIDVAIISKTDGFIWIKRKHYFNPELNYRYFNNNNS
ncbi:hypothetical protein [Halalkalibacter hemicellulosilyticus]|uniref:Uncharacterized protein n=1 Tax=Halalkalibacter hemicellulosilyticusJCM 9152 TaxID=1236971 RepID=W4QK66_9BACI|nr:hypothetical protein [Halalkalibacter hemicellulosilyticus]GAE32461.1 hypothetical protein JCM9152_3996 [Halalkalibacter hemicellulosilyticusJCM 9152]